MAALLLFGAAAVFFGAKLPSGFLPDEDQGYVYVNLQLPNSASLERTDQGHAHEIRGNILAEDRPASNPRRGVIGFSLLSYIQTSYNAFFFVTQRSAIVRTAPTEARNFKAIKQHLNQQLSHQLPQNCTAISFSP